jgi:small multidrug resistance pump
MATAISCKLLLWKKQTNLVSLYKKNMKWVILATGILFEVLGTLCMKYAEGFTKLVPSILVFVFYGISLAALVFVLEKMQVSIAYAIWASVGTALIAIIGMVFFKEPVSLVKMISISLIIFGILGLELFD